MSEVKRPTFADLFLATQKKDQADLKRDHDQTVDLDKSATRPLSNLDTQSLSYSSLDTQSPSDSEAKPLKILDTETLSHSVTKTLSNQVKGYFLPNYLQDELFPTLELAEQSVLLRIVRLTWGFNRQITDSVSLSKLAEKCNLSTSGVKKALKSLEQRGLIKTYSDLSRNAQGGNKYEILLATEKLSHSVAKPPGDHIKDLDLDLKNNKSSQAETEMMTIYTELTGNEPTKSDLTIYRKNLAHLSRSEFEQLLKNTLEKAHQKPNSIAYFVKAYQTPTQANPIQKQAIKTKIAAIVSRLQENNIGRKYTIGELADDTKKLCIREGVIFDHDIFNEIISQKY